MGLASKTLVALAALAVHASVLAAPRVSDGVVRLGVLTDLTGPYADLSGPNAVLAARMAIDDFGGKVLGARSSCSPRTTR